MRFIIFKTYLTLIFNLLVVLFILQLKLHRNVHFHPNILKFHGITKIETGNNN